MWKILWHQLTWKVLFDCFKHVDVCWTFGTQPHLPSCFELTLLPSLAQDKQPAKHPSIYTFISTMLNVHCCKKGFVLDLFVLCSGNPAISKIELTCLELRCRLLSRMLVVLDRRVLKDPICGIEYLTTHSENLLLVGNLRKLASSWQPTTAGSGRRVAVL